MNRLEFAKSQHDRKPYFETIKLFIPEWVYTHVNGNQIIYEGVLFPEDGFGYEWDGKEWVQIRHTGTIFIGENVIIHPGANIVRGTGDGDITEIGYGTKIDFGVHIAHNCKIGKNNLIHAGVVLCGSVVTGDNCIIGANSVINRKYKIGNNVEILPLSWVCQDIPDNSTWGGNPLKRIK